MKTKKKRTRIDIPYVPKSVSKSSCQLMRHRHCRRKRTLIYSPAGT